MATVTGLGGFKEVGRSAILLEGSGTFLFDYGLSVQDMAIPLRPPSALDGVLLSHAHLDHCGMLPELYKRGFSGNVYSTPATHDLIGLMLRDALKVQAARGTHSYFQSHDIEKMEHLAKSMKLGSAFRIGSAEVTFFNAGHVPGSASILVEMDGKRVLYTGDIKFSDTELMSAAFTDFTDIDLLICESTYPTKDHPDRRALRRELEGHVREVCGSGGTVVMPCFAIGRTQEMLQVLADMDVPLFLDGLGKSATEIIAEHPHSVRNARKLHAAFSKAQKIRSQGDRLHAIKTPGVIITTAGMLQGGPSHFYIQRLQARENCTLYLSGFQAPGTPGRTLQETGRYVNGEVDVQPKTRVLFRDWSAHCDRSEILAFIGKVRPRKTIFNHGPGCELLAAEVTGMGFPAFAPANGEKFEV